MMQESRRSIHWGTIGTLLTVFFISATADALTTINVPPSPDPGSAAADTIVNLLPGGTIGSTFHANSGSILNVQGGSLGGATIHGGAVGNIYSGNVYGMYATSGGVINAYDGLINNLTADSNGVLNVYGGNIIDNVDSNSSSVNIYGGAFADRFQIRVGSQLTVKATEFRLNGLSVAGLNNPSDATMIAAPPGSFLSGVFSNGVPFVLGGEGYNLPSSVNLVRSADYATGPSFISVPAVSAPQGVHSGQTLTVSTAGQLPSSFTAGSGSHVVIQGGSIGNNFEAIGATVDASAGSVGSVDAFADAVVDIGGNTQYGILSVYQKGTISVTGGIGSDTIRTSSGGKLNFSGGNFNGIITANGGEINISGGTISMYQLESTITNATKVNFTGGYVNGLLVSSGSTIDVTGGTLGHLQTAGGNVQAKVNGGKVRWLAAAYDSTVDVIAGNVGDTDASYDSMLRIRGGALGDSHEWLGGSVEMYGYDFQINGVPVAGLDVVNNAINVNIPSGSTFSGTLSDGTPFYIAPDDNYQTVSIASGVLRLIRTAIPTTPALVQVPANPAPYGAGAGQTVVVNDGGALDENFVAGRGSVVEVHGGTVGDNFEAERSQVTISGGIIGNRLDVFQGAQVTVTGGSIGQEIEIHNGGVLNLQGGQIAQLGVAIGGNLNMSGGSLGSSFHAQQGSTIEISGGSVASEFLADTGSVVNVHGGQIDNRFQAGSGSQMNVSGGHLRDLRALSGSTVTLAGGNIDDVDVNSGSHALITGGSFGDNFTVSSSSDATLSGVDFKVDGVPIAGLSAPGDQIVFTLASNVLFTGTLADGTPFAFHTSEPDSITGLKLSRSADPLPGPALIEVPMAIAPGGVHAGQQLTLRPGGTLPDNFNAGQGSTVEILGGSVGLNLEAVGAVVNIRGGQVGANLDAFTGSHINIFDGSVGTNLDAYNASEVNVAGGSTARIDALSGAAVNVSGGQLVSLQASNGSHTKWTGGTITGLNVSGAATTLAMYGADFRLNGIAIAGLQTEGSSVQFNIPASGILTAILSDGTPVMLSTGTNTPLANAQIATGTLTLFRSADPTVPQPTFQQLTDAKSPFAIGNGQTLEVLPDGQVASSFTAGPGSKLVLNGGSAGTNLKAFGGIMEVRAGAIGANFFGTQGLDMTISGGSFASGFTLNAGAHASIFGGSLPTSYFVNDGAIVDIYGTSFLLNNLSISGLSKPGDTLVVTTRGGQTLKSILTDGSLLQWQLTSPIRVNGFSSLATLRLHLVPEPGTVALCIPLLAALPLRRRARVLQS